MPFVNGKTTLEAVSLGVETVLVTGATGFVGAHVVEALSRTGVSIRAAVRKSSKLDFLRQFDVEIVTAGLEDEAAMREAVAGSDVVVHLAAATRASSAEEFARANARGTRVVVDSVLHAVPAPRKLVYLSSLAAAGPAVNGRPVQPDDEPRPLTVYGRTKLEGERICQSIAGGGCGVVILRAPAVYGPRDRDVYEFFRMARFGIMPVPTGGARPIQMVHVHDLARAVALAATVDAPTGVYHVAEPRAYLWPDIGRMVGRAVGRDVRFVRIPATAFLVAGAVSEFAGAATGRAVLFNRDKARELLAPGWLCETDAARNRFGFTAEIDLERGLAETAEWYRANGWL